MMKRAVAWRVEAVAQGWAMLKKGIGDRAFDCKKDLLLDDSLERTIESILDSELI